MNHPLILHFSHAKCFDWFRWWLNNYYGPKCWIFCQHIGTVWHCSVANANQLSVVTNTGQGYTEQNILHSCPCSSGHIVTSWRAWTVKSVLAYTLMYAVYSCLHCIHGYCVWYFISIKYQTGIIKKRRKKWALVQDFINSITLFFLWYHTRSHHDYIMHKPLKIIENFS